GGAVHSRLSLPEHRPRQGRRRGRRAHAGGGQHRVRPLFQRNLGHGRLRRCRRRGRVVRRDAHARGLRPRRAGAHAGRPLVPGPGIRAARARPAPALFAGDRVLNRLRAILRHLLVWWLPLPIALVVLLCAFALWLAGTQPGTRMLLGAVAQQFDGRAEHVRGSILGGLQVGRLQLALPGAEVDIADLRLDVHWRALGRRQLHVRELSAGAARVALTPTDEAPPPDEPLVMPALPVEVVVDRLALGSLDLAVDGAPLPVTVSGLAASLAAGARNARLQLASLHLGHAQAEADLRGQV